MTDRGAAAAEHELSGQAFGGPVVSLEEETKLVKPSLSMSNPRPAKELRLADEAPVAKKWHVHYCSTMVR